MALAVVATPSRPRRAAGRLPPARVEVRSRGRGARNRTAQRPLPGARRSPRRAPAATLALSDSRSTAAVVCWRPSGLREILGGDVRRRRAPGAATRRFGAETAISIRIRPLRLGRLRSSSWNVCGRLPTCSSGAPRAARAQSSTMPEATARARSSVETTPTGIASSGHEKVGHRVLTHELAPPDRRSRSGRSSRPASAPCPLSCAHPSSDPR